MTQCNEGFARTQAILEIEYLRRSYAKATDLIGTLDAGNVKTGTEIYHRIFAPDVSFIVSGPGTEPRTQKGPDSWVAVVKEALGPLGPTQHLIGTQLVDIETLTLGDNCEVVAGSAHMESYMRAWHDVPPDKVWLFLGTYIDEVRYLPGTGWRITSMELRRVTGERRPMDASVQAVSD